MSDTTMAAGDRTASALTPRGHAAELDWTPPGAGTWELVADHYPRPMTAAMEPFTEVWSNASTAYMQALGLPLRAVRMATVNGLPYVTFDDGGGGGSRVPPAWVLRAAVAVVPSLRRAQRRLTEVLDQRPWVAGVDQWYRTGRPAAIARLVALAGVELADLDDGDLADHLGRVYDEVLRSGAEHIALHAHDVFPPGLFLVRALELGIDQTEAFALLTGASPASTGHSAELDALRVAVVGRSAADLDELRSLDAAVAEALDDFLLHHGARLIDGYDVDCTTVGEVPELVLWLAAGPTTRPDPAAYESRRAAIESRLPTTERAAFAQLLDEARAAYGLRDDNSSLLISWPTGLLRRAMLEAGRRLAERTPWPDPTLATEATVPELSAALGDDPSVDGAELSRRRDARRRLRAADAPRTLGPAAAPAPAGMPGALGRVFQVFTLFEEQDRARRPPLHGLGIGDRPYSGRARVVAGGGDGLGEFHPGDVLVAPMTSPSYNLVLSLAGAVVTEEGGVISHAAIMARELGLPAVVGAAGALDLITDGDQVTVDPGRGVVSVHNTATARHTPSFDREVTP